MSHQLMGPPTVVSTRSRLVAAATAALVATAVILVPATAAVAAPDAVGVVAGEPSLRLVIDESDRLRSELGMPANRAYAAEVLSAAFAGGDARRVVNDWGFIGTAAEAAEMARRERVVVAFDKQRAAVTKAPGYAGHYLDNAAGGRLVIQYAGELPSPALRSAVLAGVVSTGSRADAVEFRTVAVASVDISAAMHAVWAWAGDRAADRVVAVGEDVKRNGLHVTLKAGVNPAPVKELLLARGIPATFTVGDGQEEACTSRNACATPRRGGVGIVLDGTEFCSAGWIVIRQGLTGAVTAGHCAWGTNSGLVTSGGVYGVLTTLNTLAPGAHADMRYLSTASGNPWLYQNAANKARTVTAFSFGAIGGTACLFAANSENARCGTISTTNTSHFSATCGCTVFGQFGASYSSAVIDSGGAVASNATGNLATGVHTGTFDGIKHFSSLDYLEFYGLGTLATG